MYLRFMHADLRAMTRPSCRLRGTLKWNNFALDNGEIIRGTRCGCIRGTLSIAGLARIIGKHWRREAGRCGLYGRCGLNHGTQDVKPCPFLS